MKRVAPVVHHICCSVEDVEDMVGGLGRGIGSGFGNRLKYPVLNAV
jgi:hypothetical protein